MSLFVETSEGWFRATNATVVGDVSIGRNSNLWFNVVVRGDVAPIVIGQNVNVQDGTVIHCDHGVTNTVEDDVNIGHGAIIHCARVGRGSLIGMGSRLLAGVKVGCECLIGAGAVLPPGLEVPDRTVVMGVPGRIVRPVTEAEIEFMRSVSVRYVTLARRYVVGEYGSNLTDCDTRTRKP